MLVALYALTEILAFAFFFIAFVREPRVFFFALALVTFGALAVSSFNIEQTFCAAAPGASQCSDACTALICQTESSQDLGLAAFNSLFSFVSLVYMFAVVFGYAMKIDTGRADADSGSTATR